MINPANTIKSNWVKAKNLAEAVQINAAQYPLTYGIGAGIGVGSAIVGLSSYWDAIHKDYVEPRMADGSRVGRLTPFGMMPDGSRIPLRDNQGRLNFDSNWRPIRWIDGKAYVERYGPGGIKVMEEALYE